jgi:hypothetical protein
MGRELFLAEVHERRGHLPRSEREANARLMSAAPDLLYVAELLIKFNEGNPHPEDEDSWAWFAHGMIARAQEAIAKATGES